MKTYTRPSKAQITALALTMVALGGGSYGVMSAANSAAAQTSSTTAAHTIENEMNDPVLNGSIQVADNDKNDSVKDTEKSEAAESAQYAKLAKITEAQAIKAAETKVGGTATKAELGNENGSLIYEVDINGQEVKVDAGNGKILQVEADDNEGDETNEGPEAHEANEDLEVYEKEETAATVR